MEEKIRRELESIFGTERLYFLPEDVLPYGIDASRLEGFPGYVVFAEKAEEVVELFKLANSYGLPVYPRGAGSGMVGGAVPVERGVVLSLERMNRIISIDEKNMICEVEPGIVTGELQKQVASIGLFYPPDPSSLSFSTIGGNVATGAGGPRAVKYGVTRDYVMGIEAVAPSEGIIRTGSKAIKSVVGYDLTRLLVGSEGTLAVFTRILLRLLPAPDPPWAMLVAFPDANSAVNCVCSVLRAGLTPSAAEYMDRDILNAVAQYSDFCFAANVGSLLLFEVDDSMRFRKFIVDAIRQISIDHGAIEVQLATDEDEIEKLWNIRRSISPSLSRIRRGKINEDVAVPRQSIPELVSRVKEISKKFSIPIPVFGHAGDGNLHVNIMYDPADDGERKRAGQAVEELFYEVLRMGGTISGEHGVGIAKSPFITKELGPSVMELMWRIKLAFDPHNILNPGKMFIPNRAFLNVKKP